MSYEKVRLFQEVTLELKVRGGNISPEMVYFRVMAAEGFRPDSLSNNKITPFSGHTI